MCASILVTGYPKIGKRPAPSRHRSAPRSQTVRGSRHSPITVSRQSKIGRVDRPRQRVCKHLSDRIPQDRQTARAVAPSLPDALADCARQPAQPHHRFSTVENRARQLPMPTCRACIGVIETHREQTGCAVAPSVSDFRAHCAPAPAQSQHLFSVAKSVMSTAFTKM